MIIITTYHSRKGDSRFSNRRKYLDNTIASIDKQDVKDLFHLIIDDGSTDGIYEELKNRYGGSLNRRIVRREKAKGEILTSTNARNFGINLCLNSKEIDGIDISKQKYVTFIDSDDVVIDLPKREQYILKNRIDFFYSDALLFFTDSDESFLWSGMDPKKSYYRFWMYGRMPYPTITWGIEFLRGLVDWIKFKYGIDGPFDPHIGCGEDVDVSLSSFEYALTKNHKTGYLPRITAGYRLHNLSLASIRDNSKRTKEENTVLVRHFGNIVMCLLHVGRFLIRPECYIPQLIYIRNIFRTKLNKEDFD